jgi:hypothetical protein
MNKHKNSRAVRGSRPFKTHPKKTGRRAGRQRASLPKHWSPCRTAFDLVHGERGLDYSHPLDDYTCVAHAFRELLLRRYNIWIPLEAEDGILFMQCVKLSREAFAHKPDNTIDGAGYWECLAMTVQERQRRNRRSHI